MRAYGSRDGLPQDCSNVEDFAAGATPTAPPSSAATTPTGPAPLLAAARYRGELLAQLSPWLHRPRARASSTCRGPTRTPPIEPQPADVGVRVRLRPLLAEATSMRTDGRTYRFVSVSCILSQFVASIGRGSCSILPSRAARCSLPSRTSVAHIERATPLFSSGDRRQEAADPPHEIGPTRLRWRVAARCVGRRTRWKESGKPRRGLSEGQTARREPGR